MVEVAPVQTPAHMIIGFGRYNLLLKLGQGGMGAVFLARQKTLRRFCALKVISPQYAQDPEIAERFLREARATASLVHPNLISVFDCDQFQDQYFIAMEYVEGKSLGEILKNYSKLPLPLVFHWLYQTTQALEYIHGKKIIHRDIKPDNMMIDSTGNLKIMDLGLAKDNFDVDQSMTMTGMMMGSPHFMSPEQIHDAKTADHRTDIYSLGMAFFQMLTGQLAFPKSSSAAICVAHLQETVPSVNLPDPEVTASLDGLIAKMTAKNREERFSSATEVLHAIDPWLALYPMDSGAQTFFSNLGFDERSVSLMLEKEQINLSKIDDDISSSGLEKSLIAATKKSGSMVHETATTIPVRRASVDPAPSSSNKWLKVGVVVLALIVGLVILISIKNHHKPPAIAATQPEKKVAADEKAKTPPKEIEGSYTLDSFPSGAEIRANGNLLGNTPKTFTGKPGDQLQFNLVLPGHVSTHANITLQEGGAKEIITLKKLNSATTNPSIPASPQSSDEQRTIARKNALERLNRARAVKNDKNWTVERAKILAEMESGMKQRSSQVRGHPLAKNILDKRLADIGEAMDKARRLTPSQFEAQKESLIDEMLAPKKERP